jgi:hypothetical protein
MVHRFLTFALAASLLVTSATARADETPHRSRAKQTTGIVLTSGVIGVGLLVPGIVMTVTCRQPTWTGPRALTIPIVRATF